MREFKNIVYHDQVRVGARGRGEKEGGETERKTVAERTRIGRKEFRKTNAILLYLPWIYAGQF